ncbi:MAG: TlpA family protein disulfide reductase [Gammaproteobacteria bacterium]|nr:TlpA family protein disulfide reductase [Gammaproteobacteria bacterium]
MKKILIFIVAMAVAGAAGFGLQRYLSTNNQAIAPQADSAIIGSQRTEFAMMDIDGNTRNIKDWDGQIILLNFWATWCPPCLKEIPDFIEVQEHFNNRGFQIVGIAVDDEDDVREFAADKAMNYPVMAGETEAIELSKKYGNSIGGLPYSAIIDKNGKITHTITGELSKKRLLAILKELGLSV